MAIDAFRKTNTRKLLKKQWQDKGIDTGEITDSFWDSQGLSLASLSDDSRFSDGNLPQAKTETLETANGTNGTNGNGARPGIIQMAVGTLQRYPALGLGVLALAGVFIWRIFK